MPTSFLDRYSKLRDDSVKNALLFRWLENQPGALAAELLSRGQPVFEFPSLDERKPVFLLASRKDIEYAFEHFSSQPHSRIGGNAFLLGVDEPARHGKLRQSLVSALKKPAQHPIKIGEYTHLAGTLPRMTGEIDVARFSRDVALSFIMENFLGVRVAAGSMQGLQSPAAIGAAAAEQAVAAGELRLRLDALTTRIFRGFIWSIFARHFDPDPLKPAMGPARIALRQLFGLLWQGVSDGLIPQGSPAASLLPAPGTKNFNPKSPYFREKMAQVIGSINGTIDNIVAGGCNAIDQLIQKQQLEAARDLNNSARKAAREASVASGKSELEIREDVARAGIQAVEPFVFEALRFDPPAAFLPRICPKTQTRSGTSIPEGSHVVLPVVAAMLDCTPNPDRFRLNRKEMPKLKNLMFGYQKHQCVGQVFAEQLICGIVSHVLDLPGALERVAIEIPHRASPGPERREPPKPIGKEWGALTTDLHLEFEKPLQQSPLNVVMRIKRPIAENRRILKVLLREIAPTAEAALEAVGTVHFARFVLLDNETKLGLFTSYDGPFEIYIGQFVDKVGHLFDALLGYLENDIPTPVSDPINTLEFIKAVRKYDLPPAAGFFYSAYPPLKASRVRQLEYRCAELERENEAQTQKLRALEAQLRSTQVGG